MTVKEIEGDTVCWTVNGQLHREEYRNGVSLPAYISPDETGWYMYDEYHRDEIINGESQPAIIGSNGDKLWYRDGLLHREDGPADVSATGSSWYLFGGIVHVDNLEDFIGYCRGDIEKNRRKLEKNLEIERILLKWKKSLPVKE